jgi:hypothetical protein
VIGTDLLILYLQVHHNLCDHKTLFVRKSGFSTEWMMALLDLVLGQAVLGKTDSTGIPVQETGAEIAFQPGDLPGDRRLRNREMLGGLREAAKFRSRVQTREYR